MAKDIIRSLSDRDLTRAIKTIASDKRSRLMSEVRLDGILENMASEIKKKQQKEKIEKRDRFKMKKKTSFVIDKDTFHIFDPDFSYFQAVVDSNEDKEYILTINRSISAIRPLMDATLQNPDGISFFGNHALHESYVSRTDADKSLEVMRSSSGFFIFPGNASITSIFYHVDDNLDYTFVVFDDNHLNDVIYSRFKFNLLSCYYDDFDKSLDFLIGLVYELYVNRQRTSSWAAVINPGETLDGFTNHLNHPITYIP